MKMTGERIPWPWVQLAANTKKNHLWQQKGKKQNKWGDDKINETPLGIRSSGPVTASALKAIKQTSKFLELSPHEQLVPIGKDMRLDQLNYDMPDIQDTMPFFFFLIIFCLY